MCVVPEYISVATSSRDTTAERQRPEAQTLAAWVGAIHSTLDLDTVVQHLVDSAKALGGCAWVHIALCDPGTTVTRCYPQASHDTRPALPPIIPGQGVAGQVLLTGQPWRWVNQAPAVASSGAPADEITLQVIVPLRLDNRVIGLLLAGKQAPDMCTEDDEARLVQLADYSASALHHARLYAIAVAARHPVATASGVNSTFLATMSHELRTPIHGVLDMVVALRGTPLTPRQQEYLSAVETSVASLLTVLNSMLDFSKAEAGKLTLHGVPFALRAHLDAVLKPLVLQAQHRALAFHAQIHQQVPYWVRGDPERLKQVWVNLIDNAMRFTPEGHITLTIQSYPGPSADTVILHSAIQDTGIGIPDDKQALIFEPFTQADHATARTYGGTGLGLTIAQQLVALMDGRLWVESSVGQGSTFHFTACLRIPALAPEPLVTTCMPAAPTTPLAPLHLLLVEDNPINQQVALQALAQAGHTVDMAPNGREALRILPMRPYDVILMDVQMPEMDGLETTRRIRAQAGATGRHVPIIAMTAHVMPGDQARCLAAGMDDYVAKPLQPDDLHAALRRVMTPAGPLRQAAAPVDLSVALTSAEGNTTFLHQLVQLFLPYASQQVSALRDALQAQDVRSVERLAHALRGAARALGAQAVDTLAARFETMGDDDPLTDTQSTLQSLEHELERIRDFFATSDWENFL